MNLLIFLFAAVSIVQNPVSVFRKNGEEVQYKTIEIVQEGQVKSSARGSTLVFSSRNKRIYKKIGEIRRINLKELENRKKGISTWKALLITTSNEKLEVTFRFSEIRGVAEDGDSSSIPSGSIDKISF